MTSNGSRGGDVRQTRIQKGSSSRKQSSSSALEVFEFSVSCSGKWTWTTVLEGGLVALPLTVTAEGTGSHAMMLFERVAQVVSVCWRWGKIRCRRSTTEDPGDLAPRLAVVNGTSEVSHTAVATQSASRNSRIPGRMHTFTTFPARLTSPALQTTCSPSRCAARTCGTPGAPPSHARRPSHHSVSKPYYRPHCPRAASRSRVRTS